MMMMQSLPWCEPLALAASIDEPYWALLYSGTSAGTSYLAHTLIQKIEGDGWREIQSALSDDKPKFENSWFGYLGYGLKNDLEALAEDSPYVIQLPNLCMMQFEHVYVFDHTKKSLVLYSHYPKPLLPQTIITDALPAITKLASNMSRGEYLAKAAHIIECLKNGDLYQANLTRKFHGRFARVPDAFSLFCDLCCQSPAAYSAYIRMGQSHILSSSPELFLDIAASGSMTSTPIKGSAPRHSDPAIDARQRDQLALSVKNRAENLMIVDLVRNDFARSCEVGSVDVPSLFDITSHATIHHLSSSITGKKRADCSSIDVVKACFPPGSMTGAPKIKAMQLCTTLEKHARGVYSGAMGWFGGDGSCKLSVVIRTLLLQGEQFEFQLGGGIVADSTPEGEHEELLDKSAGIAKTLGISRFQLEIL